MGVLLLIIGLAVLGFGALQHFKGKRILAAPFKKTGDLAKNPVSEDPKGAMSTEGKVVAPAQELLSPCTKQPCLAYEVKIERLFEKTETTQDGTKTVKGTETLETLKGGTVFGLDDGTGAIQIDVSKGADFDNFKDGYKKELNGHSGSSHIQFGELTFDVPVLDNDKGWTTGFKATEKFVPVEGNLFVLGKLEGAKLTKPGWRSMMTSSKGRDGLLGSIQKKKKFSFIGGGVAAVLAIPLMIFGPKADPNEPSMFCESQLTDARQQCSANVSDTDGDKYTWTVTKAGEYELTVIAPKKKISFLPQVVLKDAAGEELANQMGEVGANATVTVDVKPGTYELTVQPGDGYMVKGGFSYELEIKSLTVAAPAEPAKTAAVVKEAAPVVKEEPAEVEAEAPAKEEEVAAAPEPAAEPAPAQPDGYSDEELTARLADLNELCGDTWCEGRYGYDFKKLSCADATHCTLSFSAKDHENAKKAYEARVELSGFTTLNQDPDQEYVYEGSFDEKVGAALLAWESQPKSKRAAAIMAAKKSAAPVAKPAPVVKKAAPAAAPAPKTMVVAAAKPAPKTTTVSVAPVVMKKSAAAAPAAASRTSSKNLED